MIKKTVLKVDLSGDKGRKKLLKAISGVQGVDKIEVDAAKGTISVTGDADPYDIIVRTRKVGKFVELVSVGPPPAPPKEAQKKPEEKKAELKKDDKKTDPNPQFHYPVVYMDRYNEPNVGCSIM
ncbi:heavy-metal-associated domain-containing family protein [Gossypium australe]|uniref:Heavy-metal-associated domain-containing family protein n=1 Tax=Gossypium australe TaxID=47621 RepID=A0A5B6V2E7_9ROSI|nr:heavy-metal-associated domain-containing family protein [Gossypium australe]